MTDRDDMVITVRLNPDRAAAPVMARHGRLADRMTRGRRSLARRIMRARRARRAARRRGARSGRRAARLARGARGVATAARGGALVNPIGLTVAAAVTAAAAAVRLISGRSFGNMGASINQMILGDHDDQARARLATQRDLQRNDRVARLVGLEGHVPSEVRRMEKDLNEIYLRQIRGMSRLDEDPRLQTNNLADVIVLRVKQLMTRELQSNGTADSVRQFKHKLRGGGR